MVFQNFFSTEVELLTGSNGPETFTSRFKDIICSPFLKSLRLGYVFP